jgi:hypothetical protein
LVAEVLADLSARPYTAAQFGVADPELRVGRTRYLPNRYAGLEDNIGGGDVVAEVELGTIWRDLVPVGVTADPDHNHFAPG